MRKKTIFFNSVLFCFAATCFESLLVQAMDPFYLIVVDKAKNQIHLGVSKPQSIELVKSHHVTLGKMRGDKEVEKDLKTPEGIYFFEAKLKPPGLKKKFGKMGLMVNYPNPVDRKAGKTGYDIMLHSTDDPPRLQRDLDSEGCVVVNDEQIEYFADHVKLGLTPMLIYSELKPEHLNDARNPEVTKAFETWLNAWRSKDIDTYIGSYAPDFSYNGMNVKRYKEYKESLNKKYSEIQIATKNTRFFFHPKYNIAMFTQEYSSKLKNGSKGFKSSGTKLVYFMKMGDQYKIVSEHYTTVKED